MKNERVVITGIGVVSSIGIGREGFWSGLEEGKNGIVPITLFDASPTSCAHAGEISPFHVRDYLSQKGLKFLSRTAQFACTATHFAIRDMDSDLSQVDPSRIGVVLGTSFGNMNSLFLFDEEAYTAGVQFADPSLFPNTVVNSPAGHIAILFGFSGLNTTLSTGNASGLDVLHYGMRSLLRGDSDIVFAGGAEELSSFVHLGFLNGNALSTSPDGSGDFLKDNRSGPFEKKRKGFFLGEGSCFLGLERLEHATRRKATVLAEIIGYGNAYGSDLSIPAETMSKALDASQLKPKDVGFISASGNGSPVGDRREGLAVEEVFGKQAGEIPITAIKSMLGECCGASGTLQVAAAVCSLLHHAIPPTIHIQEVDPELPIQNVITETQRTNVDTVMVNAFNERGNHSTIILKRP